VRVVVVLVTEMVVWLLVKLDCVSVTDVELSEADVVVVLETAVVVGVDESSLCSTHSIRFR